MHHMGQQEIIRKFNEIFNAVAEDVRKQYGENLYDLQKYDNDELYNTNAGMTFTDTSVYNQPEFDDTPSTAVAALTYDSYQGELTAKEKKYLTEMVYVFNDEKAAIGKTYQKFSKFGASPALTKLYNESFLGNIRRGIDYLLTGNDMTEDEECYMKELEQNGYSHKQAVGKTYFKFREHASNALKSMFRHYDSSEACESEEEIEEDDEMFSAPPAYGMMP